MVRNNMNTESRTNKDIKKQLRKKLAKRFAFDQSQDRWPEPTVDDSQRI